MYQSPSAVVRPKFSYLLWVAIHVLVALFVVSLYHPDIRHIGDMITTHLPHQATSSHIIAYMMLESLIGILCSFFQSFFIVRPQPILRWLLVSWTTWILIGLFRTSLRSIDQFNYDGGFWMTTLLFTAFIGALIGGVHIYLLNIHGHRWRWILLNAVGFSLGDVIYAFLASHNIRSIDFMTDSIFTHYYLHAVLQWGFYSITTGLLIRWYVIKINTV